MNIIQKFFEIFNFRFWLFLFELFYIPAGLCIGGLIWEAKQKRSEDEVQ